MNGLRKPNRPMPTGAKSEAAGLRCDAARLVFLAHRHARAAWRTNEAPSPTALLLSALAGCAVVFIRDTLAPQLGVTVDAIEATAQCETDARGLLGMDGVAPDVGNVGLTIAIQSPEDEDAVRRVYQAWQERCPVYLALTKALPVATTLDIKRS
jgi:uncharacterized OsmC-like protein